MEMFHSDFLFRKVAGDEIFSQETYRQRLYALAEKDGQHILDVSVFEDTASYKEGVVLSYHKIQKFAPIFCYAGREGFMVTNQLRPRSQHCENGAVKFLKQCIIMIQAGYQAEELLVPVDSGYDSSNFIKTLSDLEFKYLIKRNLRKENPRQLLDSIHCYETSKQVRPGMIVYRGIRSDRIPTNFPKYKGFMTVETIERIVLANGQTLLIPSIELDSW